MHRVITYDTGTPGNTPPLSANAPRGSAFGVAVKQSPALAEHCGEGLGKMSGVAGSSDAVLPTSDSMARALIKAQQV